MLWIRRKGRRKKRVMEEKGSKAEEENAVLNLRNTMNV